MTWESERRRIVLLWTRLVGWMIMRNNVGNIKWISKGFQRERLRISYEDMDEDEEGSHNLRDEF